MNRNNITRTALALAATGGLALATAAYADDSDDNARDFRLNAMDANGDGMLSPEEHAAGARKMFEAMDISKDGQVTADEMDAAHMRVTGHKRAKGDLSAAAKIRFIDTDGDGALTAEEHAVGSKRMFEKMDTDKDGQLTNEEMVAAHALMLRKSSR